jgi:hypothetical protein
METTLFEIKSFTAFLQTTIPDIVVISEYGHKDGGRTFFILEGLP